jgi:hypothetical protein
MRDADCGSVPVGGAGMVFKGTADRRPVWSCSVPFHPQGHPHVHAPPVQRLSDGQNDAEMRMDNEALNTNQLLYVYNLIKHRLRTALTVGWVFGPAAVW